LVKKTAKLDSIADEIKKSVFYFLLFLGKQNKKAISLGET